jgi:hypothetical protein
MNMNSQYFEQTPQFVTEQPLKHVVSDGNASLSPRKQNFIENFIAMGTIKVSTDKVISKKIYY